MSYDSHQRLLNTLKKIKAGDRQAREDFLAEYKPFILKTANNFCKRSLEWGRDDELSISLIAFNSAIDTFDFDKQVPFLPYSRIVIVNRLKDYFRKESRHQNECPLETELEDGKIVSSGEIKTSWENHRNRTIEDERQEELEHFEEVLSGYDIGFEDLVEVSPKHRDSRMNLFKVARTISIEKSLFDYLCNKKQLPLKELVEKTGVNRKTLERGRKFIIASALILSRPEEFVYLRSYINFGL
ncbi:MAG: RNA polymerase sigma-I factor [Bacillota bacterium]